MNTVAKPKIAIISVRNTYNYGGVLSSLKVMHNFCQQYFEPTVFFLGFDRAVATSIRSLKFSSTFQSLTYFGMHCVEVGARWAFWEPGLYKNTIPTWQLLLQDYDYFIVVSGTCIAAHPLLLLNKPFAQWIGTPYEEDRAERVKQLTGIHFLIDKLASQRMKKIEKEILQKARFTWAISSYAKIQFEQILQEKKQNTIICGYPIDCSKILPINPNKEKIILAVGRFSDPRKNSEMLVRAFDKIHRQIPDLMLYIVGKKPPSDKMSLFATYSCFKNIVFTGQVSTADLTTLYRRASLLLITSHQEGLGIVGLEAMLHGTPVIATNCGGPQDYVIDGKTGYLVDINDDETMARKAIELLKDKQLLKVFRQQARQHIEEHFSWESIHELFKQGLIATYPELDAFFANHQPSEQHVIQQSQQAQSSPML